MRLVLIGGGGHAAAVADVARSAGFTIDGVITPDGAPPSAARLPRLGGDDWIDTAPVDVGFHLAFGAIAGRRAVFERLSAGGRSLPTIRAASASVGSQVTLGDATILMNGTIVNAATRIGRNCIINTRALIEHDCRIDDHTHVAPGAIVSGGVSVGRGVLVGAGAVLLPGISVADHVVIGAGAVVVKSIDAPGTWFGNPAREQ